MLLSRTQAIRTQVQTATSTPTCVNDTVACVGIYFTICVKELNETDTRPDCITIKTTQRDGSALGNIPLHAIWNLLF